MSEWQPIDSAPKDGARFIGYGNPTSGHDAMAQETYWQDYGKGSLAFDDFKNGKGPKGAFWWSEPVHNWTHSWKPTHWMPLPEPPK
jgi:hypothetical protein